MIHEACNMIHKSGFERDVVNRVNKIVSARGGSAFGRNKLLNQ